MTLSSRYQVRVIRDIVGTAYYVVDTSKPDFCNGHSNSLGTWPTLADAEAVAASATLQAIKAHVRANQLADREPYVGLTSAEIGRYSTAAL